MSATKDAGLVLVYEPNIYSFGKVTARLPPLPQEPAKGRAYTFANPAEVRQLANGAWLYTSTGKFAPTKNGRPLSLGFKKDKRGRVYNPKARAARARANFGLGAAPKAAPVLTPEQLEAVAAVAGTLEPGTPAVGGRYLNTVARWAEAWIGYLIYYYPDDPEQTARIRESAPLSDSLAVVAANIEEAAEEPRYLDKAGGEKAFPIIVPLRFG